MSNFGSPTFGMEEISNEVLRTLVKHLATDIDLINAKYYADDAALAEDLNREFFPVALEPVVSIEVGEGKPLTDNFHSFEGTFPRVNIIAAQSSDTGEGGDHATQFAVPVNIECWIKAGPSEGPSVAFKRASRIIEAVNLSMARNPTLNGLVLALTKNPRAAISRIITKDLETPNVNLDNTFNQDQLEFYNGWYLCGGGVVYNVLKNSSI